MDFRGLSVCWDGHASVRVEDEGFTVAVDPFSDVNTDFSADIVLITHEDVGHFDEGALDEVRNGRTVFVCPESLDLSFRDVEHLEGDGVIDVYGVEIEAVPMYNGDHAKGDGLGYRFSMGDTSFYVAGDTGLIDEMRDLERRVDLAFLPIGGEYTMDVSDAVQAAVRIKPEVVVPYHFGEPFLSDRDSEAMKFRAELMDRNINCEILEKEN